MKLVLYKYREVKYMLNSNSYYLNSFVNKNQDSLSLDEEILQKAQFINMMFKKDVLQMIRKHIKNRK